MRGIENQMRDSKEHTGTTMGHGTTEMSNEEGKATQGFLIFCGKLVREHALQT